MQAQNQPKTNNKYLNDFQRFLRALTTDINWINSSLTILFIGALFLTVYEINIYRRTFIHWAVPSAIGFLTGLILTPLTSSLLEKHYKTKGFFFQLFFNVVTWGGLLIFAFMATNYYFAKDKSKTISTKIIRTGHLAKGRNGCGEPYCEILINNYKKQLVFPCDFDIENYNEIDLTIKKGFWGFDIITDKKPKNGKKNALLQHVSYRLDLDSADTFVLAESSVLGMNICGKKLT